MSQVVIENPIINLPFDDAKRIGLPTLDEAAFKKLLGTRAMEAHDVDK